MSCKVHPKYKAIRKPKSTDKFKSGCPDCWKLYNKKNGNEEEVSVKAEKKSPKQKKGKEVQPQPKPKMERKGSGAKSTRKHAPRASEEAPVKSNPEPVERSGACGCGCTKDAPKPLSWAEVSKKFKTELDALIDETAERKIAEAKVKIASSLQLEFEHLFIEDEQWHRNVLTNLEKEGWQWMHYTYPLAKNGIVKKDYHLLKRVKMSGQKAAPDLLNEKIMKRYRKL